MGVSVPSMPNASLNERVAGLEEEVKMLKEDNTNMKLILTKLIDGKKQISDYEVNLILVFIFILGPCT